MVTCKKENFTEAQPITKTKTKKNMQLTTAERSRISIS